MTTFRVWLQGGRYQLVDAETSQEAIRKLTRTQRRRALLAVAILSERVNHPESETDRTQPVNGG